MAAPQLLAGVEGAELGSTEELGWDGGPSGTVTPPQHPTAGPECGNMGNTTHIGSALTAVHVL